MRTFLIVALLIVVLLVGGAFYLQWLSISTASTTGQAHVGVDVNKEKIQEDLKKAKDKLQESVEAAKQRAGDAKEKVQDAADNKTLTGTIVKTDEAKGELVVAANGIATQEVGVKIDAQTKIQAGDKAGILADLKGGRKVSVMYQVKDGVNVAKSVTLGDN